jgi:regulator of protease activity HflC (stomatin/prohibitin superfamily)
VGTAEVALITRFGKFLRVAEPGLNWKRPFFDTVAGTVSLRGNQITLTMETKTKDNVFVTIPISVQNRVRPEKVYDAYYKVSDPVTQSKSDSENQRPLPETLLEVPNHNRFSHWPRFLRRPSYRRPQSHA